MKELLIKNEKLKVDVIIEHEDNKVHFVHIKYRNPIALSEFIDCNAIIGSNCRKPIQSGGSHGTVMGTNKV